MGKLQLKRVRASLGLTQKGLAELAGVADATIASAEGGRRQIRMMSAYAILNALNPLLREKGRAELDIDSLDWDVEE